MSASDPVKTISDPVKTISNAEKTVNQHLNSAHHPNAVTRLRLRELAYSQRKFSARGSRLRRCADCLLARHLCICGARPMLQTQCAFCFIMYKGEVYKPSNTGRLIADVVADNYAFLWERTQTDKELLALLKDERYTPILIFPHQYAEAGRCIHNPLEHVAVVSGKIPLFVVLDGTWREAKKMFKSPYLANLPVLGIQPDEGSTYVLREAAHTHQLCTAEVGVEVLRLANERVAAEALQDYFNLFQERYASIRAHVRGRNL